MSYKANIHEFDRDYHSSYGRDVTIDVDSWKEAVAVVVETTFCTSYCTTEHRS